MVFIKLKEFANLFLMTFIFATFTISQKYFFNSCKTINQIYKLKKIYNLNKLNKVFTIFFRFKVLPENKSDFSKIIESWLDNL